MISKPAAWKYELSDEDWDKIILANKAKYDRKKKKTRKILKKTN